MAGISRLSRGPCRRRGSAGRRRRAPGHLLGAVSDDGDQYASTAEVAEVLVKLHALTAPDDLRLPELAPFANAPQRIETNTWLNPEDRAFLTDHAGPDASRI